MRIDVFTLFPALVDGFCAGSLLGKARSLSPEHLRPAGGGSHCEWKGVARYYDVVTPDVQIPGAAWGYDDPYAEFERLRGHVSFYPDRVECWLGGERVEPQPGRFYGGWVTPELTGPFKGERGSEGW